MNTNDLTSKDRANLTIIFRLFRTDAPEDDYRGYAHRDVIEQKLRTGEE